MERFNLEEMEEIFKSRYEDFEKFIPYNKEKDYYFQDNGSKVLAVAHLDYVGKNTHFEHVKLPHKEIVFSPVCDNRLGAYIILRYLKQKGLKYDILLTNNEEIGASTASRFSSEKQYNWVFSFDRNGVDPVMYQYETPEMARLLKSSGFSLTKGSYSDISRLEHLECKCFNFGTHYYDEHSLDSFANLTSLKVGLNLFCKFFKIYKNTRFKHEIVHVPDRYETRNRRDSWRRLDEWCVVCGNRIKVYPYQNVDRDFYEFMQENCLCYECADKYYSPE